MTEREQFEAWASDNYEWPQCIERSGDGYKLMQTTLKWEAWQAARAQPAQVPRLTDDLERFLDSAAGTGFVLAGVDAAELYVSLFPERYKAALIAKMQGDKT